MAKNSTRKPPVATAKSAVTVPSNTNAWLLWGLAAATFLLYSFSFSNKMVSMDDHSATVNNSAVTDFAIGQFNLGMYAPVTWLGYAIAYTLGKDNSFWYHLLSTAVHAFNVVLVFKLFQKLQATTTVAAVVAMCFALHPLQVEAVAWIAAFSTPLYAMFSLLALNFYVQNLHDVEKSVDGRFPQKYWLTLGMFLLACLSKSAAVALPLTLIVLDMWLRRPINMQEVFEKLPFLALSLGFGALTLYSRISAVDASDVAVVPVVYSMSDRFLMICHTVLFYWAKIIAPLGLSIWYPFEKTASGGWHWTYYASPVALAAIIYLAWRLRERIPFVWYGLLFYLANIVVSLPYATFGTFELRFDRYNYLACLGIFAILAMLPGYFGEKKSPWEGRIWAIICVLALFWLTKTALRIRDWKDSVTLMTRAIETTGDNYGRAYLWRGMEYGDNGKAKEAVADLTLAIQKNPGLTDAYKYRGGLYGLTKQYAASVADMDIYLKRKPDDAEQRYNRGLSLLNLNRVPEAIVDFENTLKINPDFFRAYRARGNAYKLLGETAKSEADLAEWERRSQSQPQN